MVIGLDKKYFAYLLNSSLYSYSYRELGEELGLSISTFTRVKQEKDISVNSFIIILCWIKTINKMEWNSLMKLLIHYS